MWLLPWAELLQGAADAHPSRDAFGLESNGLGERGPYAYRERDRPDTARQSDFVPQKGK